MTADPYALLRAESEPTPDWLMAHAAGQPFPRHAFFSSRVIYYPGSAADGHPLKLFGGTHSAHCFVYVDYGHSKAYFEEQLADSAHVGHPRGYSAVTVIGLRKADYALRSRTRRADPARATASQTASLSRGRPFALFAVLERNEELAADHGPARLAILVVGGEAMETYDALFCQDNSPGVPYAVILQDHGFGGNWTHFGGDSRLWRLAAARPPRWLLVADGTPAWRGYERVSSPDIGGMHANARSLFQRR